jgi:uncharacterized iron-regulated protein
MRNFILILFIVILSMALKNDKPAYRIFNEKGRSASYNELIKEASDADIIFFGELHDVSICHWLEYEVMSDLYKEKGKNLIIGAEMFESDNQLILDEYLAKLVKDKNLEAEARLWPNYKTDYKPLLTFARDSNLIFIATNIPRRYASMVSKSGFEILETLRPDALKFIVPLPVKYDPELACYKDIVRNMGDSTSHANMNIAKAQAVKDATMAHFILSNYQKGKTFLHFNGSYHSDKFQGIVWYLKQANPSLKIMTISSVQQADLEVLQDESKGIANFVFVIPENMTKTQ